MKITGSVVYNDFEGGFWGLVDDSGEKYFPVDGLPKDHQIEGLRIEASIERSNAVTFIMWGRPIRLLSIIRL